MNRGQASGSVELAQPTEREMKVKKCVYAGAFIAELGLLFWLGMIFQFLNDCKMTRLNSPWFTLMCIFNIALQVPPLPHRRLPTYCLS